MQINKGRKAYDDINITPMLDLAYVLLGDLHPDGDGERAGDQGGSSQGVGGAESRPAQDDRRSR